MSSVLCNLIYIYIYIYNDSENNPVYNFVVHVTCGNGTLSPNCEVCPKPLGAPADYEWCDGNCRMDKIDGDCKQKRRLCNENAFL